MKPPKYNPLRMGEKKYADDYAKKLNKYLKQNEKTNI
jgi:hypothetical protein